MRALFVTPEKKARPIPLDKVSLSRSGFEGDFHAKDKNPRQILMVSSSVLDEFAVPPGALFENLVIDNLDVMSLDAGRRLHIGEAVLEVTMPCEPCVQMDRLRKGLKEALNGKRGMFAKVVTTGVIRVGDSVRL